MISPPTPQRRSMGAPDGASEPTPAAPSRRSLAHAAAWSTPALVAVAAAPAYAGSPTCLNLEITGLIGSGGSPAPDVTLWLADADGDIVDVVVTTSTPGTNYVLQASPPMTATYTVHADQLIAGWSPTSDGSSLTISAPPCSRRLDGEVDTAKVVA